MGLALGNLTATLLGQQSALPAATVEIQREPTPNKGKKITLAHYQPIISHNIFNSALSTQPATRLDDESQGSRTASKWSLVGTVSGGELPLATLKDSQGAETFQLDDELPDGAVLTVIERNRVKLRYADGRVQTIEMIEDELKGPSAKLKNAAPQIESLGDNRWLIPAMVAEDARTNVGELLKQAQAVPFLEEGKTTGFQLRRIRRNSLVAQLGLKRGDIISSINDIPLNSPEKALQLFGQLRQASKVSIDLKRRGKAMTFAYEIR